MTSVNYYKIYCNDESSYVYTWDTEEPTVCPNINTHSIDTNSITIEQTVEEETVNVNEEKTNPTGGHFRVMTENFDAPGNTTTTYDFSYNLKVAAINVMIPTSDNQEGDLVSMMVAPYTTVGAITNTVSSNDTTINVSQSVTDNVDVGYKMTLTDGNNTDEIGQITSIDKQAGTITVDVGATNSFSPLTPTYVQLSILYMDEWEIGRGWVYEFGQSKIGASAADAGTVIRVIYKNNTADTKRVRIVFENLY